MRLALALLVLAACSGKDPTNPGEKIGTFHVTGKLTATTCGEAPNPWQFDMRLNHDGETLYWLQGQLPIAGSVDRTAHTTMTASTTTDVGGGCSIKRNDALVMALETSAAQPAIDPSTTQEFEASIEYVFAPTEGSNCEAQLVASGGTWNALPCTVRYSLSGALANGGAQ